MVNKQNIEAFYDYFDEVANILYTNYQKSYIDGMNEAFNFLLDNQFEGEYQTEDMERFEALKEEIVGLEFSSEDVRKAVQLGLLKGYKHTFSSNAQITPDTIGIFVGYLIKKLYHNKEIKSILDPLVGTGNLAYTVMNQLEKEIKLYGIDNDIVKCNLARNLGDLMDYQTEIFYQDTLTYYDNGFDLIITDMPIQTDDQAYLPYQVLNHHIDSLQDGKYLISVIDNDFFEKKDSHIFREEILKTGHIIGLIKLSETLFKNNPKSILIIRKQGKNVTPLKDFLLVDLPSFNEMEDFNKTVNQIDLWFSEREDVI